MNEQETDNNDFPFPVTDSFLVIWEFAGDMAFPGSSAGKKNPPAMQETLVQFLGWKNLLEKILP